MKKFTALISALLITLNCINVSAKVNNDYTNITEIDGIVFTEGSENSGVSVSSGNLLLDANVSTETEKTGAYYISPLIGIGENDDILNFTCKFEVIATDSLTANRYIQLAWGDISTLDSVEKTTLINVTKNKVRVGSSNKDYVAVNNGTHLICGYVNLEDEQITVYYDGVAIAENQNISMSEDFDISTARLMFSNYFTPSAQNQYSEFYINSYLASTHNSQNGPEIKTIADELGVINASSLANGFYINFGAGLKTEPTATLYESYGTENEREIEIDSTYNGYMVNIVPKNENFADMKSYAVIIDGISYVSGETITQKAISFTTLDENYERPSIAITSPEDSAVLMTGREAKIVTEVTQGSEEIEKVEILVNNDVIDTLTDSGESEWTPENAGTYEIKAVVTDSLGTSSEDSISVSVRENIVPVVSFDVTDGAVVSTADIIKIQTSDEDGDIEYVEIYSNGILSETVDSENVAFNVSSLGNGKHSLEVKAYDNDGGVGSSSINITVVEEVSKQYVDENFEKFTSSIKTFAGCNLTYTGGYIEPVIIDEEHGTSFSIGTTQEHYTLAGNKRDIWFQVNANKDYNIKKAALEFDIMLNNAAVLTMIRGNTALAPDATTAVQVYPYSIGNQISFGGQTIDIIDDTWYHIKYIPDIKKHTGTLIVTGNGNTLEGTASIDSNLDRISSEIRMTFSLRDKTKTDFKVIIDNLKFSKISELPSVNGVTDSDDSTVIDYSSEYIKVTMNGNMSEIEADDIVLYNTNGDQAVKKVEIDETDASVLYIYPEGDFISGDDYTLKIKSGVVSEAGTYTNDTIYNFTTLSKQFDVLNGLVNKTGNNISFTASFANTTGDTKYSTMLLVLYKDGVFESITPKPVVVDTVSKSDTVSVTVTSGNYTAYGLVVDEVGGMMPTSNKLFKLK